MNSTGYLNNFKEKKKMINSSSSRFEKGISEFKIEIDIKDHEGPFDLNCLSDKDPMTLREDILKCLVKLKINYKSSIVLYL